MAKESVTRHANGSEKKYWAYKNNQEGALKNGSFVREYRHGGKLFYAQYMNGDFMESTEDFESLGGLERYALVDTKWAVGLLPDCNK